MNLSYLIPFLLIGFIPIYGATDFYAHVPKTATQQNDYCINLWAYDDRRGGYMQSTALRGAEVTIEITLYGNLVERLHGFTYRSGFYAACDFVTSADYRQHALYEVEITVNETSKKYWVWTVRGRA